MCGRKAQPGAIVWGGPEGRQSLVAVVDNEQNPRLPLIKHTDHIPIQKGLFPPQSLLLIENKWKKRCLLPTEQSAGKN